MATVTETAFAFDLQSIVDEIVKRFQPIKIVLFGSYADGTATRDSDVDLMVVINSEESTLHAAARIAAAIAHPLPVDVVVTTPDELKRALQQGYVFETEVLKRGIVLYEAENDRVD